MKKEFLNLGESIELRIQLPDGTYSLDVYSSKVQDIIRKTDILITPPTSDYEKWLRRVVKITFIRENGLYSAPAKIIGKVEEDQLLLLHLKILDEFTRIQRRKFYRLKICLDVNINGLTKANTIDISGNGMLIISKTLFEVGAYVSGSIDLEGSGVFFKGVVVRVKDAKREGYYQTSIHFNDIDEDVQDTIIKFIYSKQLQMLKNNIPL